jgi:hypothetical protein
MSYNYQSTDVELPFAAPITATLHLFALDRRGENDIHESDLYYLHVSRNGNLEKLSSGDVGTLPAGLSDCGSGPVPLFIRHDSIYATGKGIQCNLLNCAEEVWEVVQSKFRLSRLPQIHCCR